VRPKRAVVIGAGLGGLAVALRLLHQGLDVVILEREAAIGGRAAQIRGGGFTFDVGPSLITMPWVLEELFELAGTRLQERLRLHRLDPFHRVCWQGEGRSFLVSGEREAMLEQIGQFSADDARRYDAFLAAGRRMYQKAILAAGSRDSRRFPSFLRLLPARIRLGAIRPLDGLAGRFFKEPHVRQAFGFQPLLVGGDPYRAAAVCAALAYLQVEHGVWYAEGGVHALVKELGRLITQGGGRMVTGRRVTRVLTSGDRVRGVRTAEGEEVSADLVVSNADALATQSELLGRSRPGLTATMSCFLLYLGVRNSYPSLQHHTLLFGAQYSRFIRDLSRGRLMPDRLWLSVQAPARTEAAMAPPGGESISVQLPVPNLRNGVDWGHAGPELRERVLDALESPEGLDLACCRDSIDFEACWTPLDFRDRLGAVDGNAFGAESTLSQSAYVQTPKRDRKLPSLYYVGAGTHPGAGIPGVLLGAEVTARLVSQELGSHR
jgi:phytoene desaturase